MTISSAVLSRPRRSIRRMFLLTGLALVGILTMAERFAPSLVHAKPKYQLKIATIAPDGSTWMNLMHELDDAVQAETGGEVGLKFYPGGIQGDEPIVLRKIATGQLHGGGLTGVGLGTIAPELRVLELPFLFRDESEVAWIHERMDPKFESILYDAGYTLLGWADVGFVYLYSKDPIATKADLNGQKLWLWEGDPLAEEFLSKAGVAPVPLSITDVMTSLQTGLITSVYVSPLACIALQWFTRVGDTTDVPITHAMGAVVVTNAAWEKIPEAHRATVRKLADEYFAKLQAATTKENAQSAQVIAESGVKTVHVSDAEVESLRAIGKDVASALTGKLYPAELLQQVEAELGSCRAKAGTTGALVR